jgi:hypothetical protein
MKTDYRNVIKERMKDLNSFLDVELNPDDPKLVNQITLKGLWDNPKALSKALDMQPAYFARWATMLRNLKKDRMRLQAEYDVWASNKRQRIRETIINDRKKKGLTSKQASNVTQSMVDDEFNKKYSYTGTHDKYFIKYKKPLDDIDEYIDKVTVIVEAFKMRKDLLVVQGYLLRSMMENKLTIMKGRK